MLIALRLTFACSHPNIVATWSLIRGWKISILEIVLWRGLSCCCFHAGFTRHVKESRRPWSDRGQSPRSKWVWWPSKLLLFLVHSVFTLFIFFLTILMLIFRLGLGANVFGTPIMGFTLPIYAHDMAMVIAAQPSPSKASTPSPGYDPRALDFFELFVEVDNACHTLDSTSDEGGHEGSIFGNKKSSSDNLMVDWFLVWLIGIWIYKVWCGFNIPIISLNASFRCYQITLHLVVVIHQREISQPSSLP